MAVLSTRFSLVRFFAGSWLVAAASILHAATPEYQVKAVFLFNFAQFVEWPAQAFADAGSPLVLGVLGDDPFDTVLEEAVRSEKVNNRSLVVRRYRRPEDIEDCHILFICRSEASHFGEIVARLHDRSILTVGDAEGFNLRGGMIRFITESNKTRLRINAEAAKAAHLTLSSKLLRPAEIVAPGKD